jgi:hypothetical protein
LLLVALGLLTILVLFTALQGKSHETGNSAIQIPSITKSIELTTKTNIRSLPSADMATHTALVSNAQATNAAIQNQLMNEPTRKPARTIAPDDLLTATFLAATNNAKATNFWLGVTKTSHVATP